MANANVTNVRSNSWLTILLKVMTHTTACWKGDLKKNNGIGNSIYLFSYMKIMNIFMNNSSNIWWNITVQSISKQVWTF